jgi:hypothetical protein
MAVFVHLASERDLARIRRGGLAPRRGVVFAMPVGPDFQASHQWARELERWAKGTLVAVYFRLPGRELVWAGRYGRARERVSADEAVARFLRSGEAGYEVVIPRRIRPRELLRLARAPRLVGWRYFPEAKGRPPVVCLHCERGWYGVRRLVRAADRAAARGRKSQVVVLGR